MISHLSVKNFALIDTLTADFYEGLNIITGETGAGKSIIIEAISMALGNRADTTYIRSGKDKAIIQLVIDIKSPSVLDVLEENDIQIDNNTLIITREIFTSGKSICKINDTLVTVSLLNKICSKIVDIHGQYDHQSLLNSENHLNLIDSYDSAVIEKAKIKFQETYSEYTHLYNDLNKLIKAKDDFERKKDFLQYELNEISAACLIPGEDESLQQSLNILQNSEKIFQNLSISYDLIFGDEDDVISKLGKASSLLKEIAVYDSRFASIESGIIDNLYQLESICEDIRKYKDSIQYSPHQLDEIQERLELINMLKKKYGNSIEKILEYKEKIQKELQVIENADDSINDLESKLKEIELTLKKESEELSNLRKKAALRIEEAISKELMELNFNHADFVVYFRTNMDSQGNLIYSPNGTDIVEFLISTNKGEPVKPLTKIASGGEISRIMLAFKRIIGDFDGISTMIFDEIDNGISGATASIVGKKLAQISKNHQIICITHLPQIAVMGNQNYLITKKSDTDSTQTILKELSEPETIEEIARMLGGEKISSAAIKNAEDMLNQSKVFYSTIS